MNRAARRGRPPARPPTPSPTRRGSRRGPPWRGCRPRPARTGSRRSRRPPSRSSGRRHRGRPRRWRAPSRACRGSGRRSARAGCRPPRPARSALATWPGTPTPIVSPKQTSSTPSSSSRSATSTARAGSTATGVRAAEGGRDVATPPPAELAGARQDRRERGQRLRRRSSRCWRGVNASVAAVKTAIASAPAASARAIPRTFGTRTG